MDQSFPTASCQEVEYLGAVSTLARRFARLLLLRADADDVAQDVVLDCLVSLRAGTPPIATDDLPRVIRTIVLRRIINLCHANGRRARRDAEHARDLSASEHGWMSPDLAVDAHELEGIIATTLSALPQRCRLVFTMVRDEGLTYREAANALGITPAAVCHHVVIAQRRLRAALQLDSRTDTLMRDNRPPYAQASVAHHPGSRGDTLDPSALSAA